MDTTPYASFKRLYEIIVKLRSPEGCPWDREQTPESIKGNLLEEAYEVIEALGENNDHNLKEELGDLYLLITMMAYMKQQEGSFSVSDALEDISEKLIRRHPHVFGDVQIEDPQEVLLQWEKIKTDVEGRDEKNSALDSIPRTIPPLERAFLLQKQAAKLGFDWDNTQDVISKVHEEIKELEEAFDQHNGTPRDQKMLEGEFGDLLFSLINLARFLNVDPAIALHMTNQKFLKRFKYIEKKMQEQDRSLTKENFKIMDSLWDEAKNSGL